MGRAYLSFTEAGDAVRETFAPEALEALYPRAAGSFAHALAEAPCFAWDRLAATIEAGKRSLVEVREDGPAGRFRQLAALPGDLRPLVSTLPQARRWIMLRDLARWPDFAELVADLVARIEPVVKPRTGAMVRPVAFLFVSSPGLLTPLHFDPEYNILFQIAGTKRFSVLQRDAGLPSREDNQRFHATGDNLLGWRQELEAQADHFALQPGDALHVPFKAAHMVRVGEAPSISLSLTWRSRDSLLQDDAWALDALLARRGLQLEPPGRRPWLRGTVMRALRRAHLA